MQALTNEQLEKLIKEEKWDELGASLKELIEEESDGSEMLDAVRAYVKLKTSLTADYNKKLDELIREAEKAVEAGKKMTAEEK